MKKSKLCPHCGAKMQEYPHTLSRSLARVIYRITKNLGRDNRFHIADCELTHNQAANLQKLAYWRIIAKAPDATAKGGFWDFTDLGLAFAQGRIRLRKKVWTYRGEFVRFDGDQVSIMDVADGWKYRPDYAREGRPHPSPDDQPELPL